MAAEHVEHQVTILCQITNIIEFSVVWSHGSSATKMMVLISSRGIGIFLLKIHYFGFAPT
jgi:hypothetical protein